MPKDFISDEEFAELEKKGEIKDFISDEEMRALETSTSPDTEPVEVTQATEEGPGFLERMGERAKTALASVPGADLGRRLSAGVESGIEQLAYASEDVPAPDFRESMRRRLEEKRAGVQKMQEEYPVAALTGKVGPLLPLGVAAGVGASVGDVALEKDFDPAEIAKAGAIETAGVLVGKGAGKVASRLLSGGASKTAANAAAESSAGLSSSKKLIKESLGKRGIGKYKDGEIGAVLRKEGIVTAGATPTKIYERIGDTLEKKRGIINYFASRPETKIDPKILLDKLNAAAAKVKGKGIESEKVRAAIHKAGEKFDDLQYQGGTDSLEGLLAEKRRLGKAFRHRDTLPASAEGQQEAYKVYNDVIKDTIEETQGKAARKQFEIANKESEMLMLSQDAALNQASSSGGMLDKAGDISLAHGNVAQAAALKSRGWVAHNADTLKAAGYDSHSKIFKNPKIQKALDPYLQKGDKAGLTAAMSVLLKRDQKAREAYNKEQEELKNKED